MGKFRTPTEYYYCPDYDRYVMREGGIFYSIENGVVTERHRVFDKILIGDIYTEDISKEEFESHIREYRYA